MSRVGEKIKAARQTKGMSKKQLAKKLGVSEKFINEVEIGRRIANQSVIDRLSKILGQEINDVTMNFEEEVYKDDKSKYSIPVKEKKINSVWSDAFSEILKDVPIYDYSLTKSMGFRKLPVINNKIDGYSKDKVVYIKVQDDDMLGFRIQEGDLVLGHLTQEVENNSIFLLEYKGIRAIRQIKKLDNNKVLLISNRGTLRTETVGTKDFKPILKLYKLEINLS
ncbi:helix-turn-helix domain-containing protein [Clostridium sp.]|uniref:helix-turn-helix domain-containing protein n=1 Tax=Clostridium sp. TaxID=1506 RepID=UPI003A5B9D0F